MRLWHNPDQMAFMNCRRYIVQLSSILPGHSHKNQHLLMSGTFFNTAKLFSGGLNEGLLQKQISAGISGQTQLRKHHNPHSQPGPLFHLLTDLFPVKHRVRHLNFRSNRRHTQKTIHFLLLQSAAFGPLLTYLTLYHFFCRMQAASSCLQILWSTIY